MRRGRESLKIFLLKLKNLRFWGIAGVEGNGQKELIESIIGINDIESGEILSLMKIKI